MLMLPRTCGLRASQIFDFLDKSGPVAFTASALATFLLVFAPACVGTAPNRAQPPGISQAPIHRPQNPPKKIKNQRGALKIAKDNIKDHSALRSWYGAEVGGRAGGGIGGWVAVGLSVGWVGGPPP